MESYLEQAAKRKQFWDWNKQC